MSILLKESAAIQEAVDRVKENVGTINDHILLSAAYLECHMSQDETNAIVKRVVNSLAEHPVYPVWTCAHTGRGGVSWLRGWGGSGTRLQAEEEAVKHCNVVAIPLPMMDHIENIQRRMAWAEGRLNSFRVAISDTLGWKPE